MSEAFECFVCRKIMALFGADPNRCPSCGSVHGNLITKRHFHPGKSAGRSARPRRHKKDTRRAGVRPRSSP